MLNSHPLKNRECYYGLCVFKNIFNIFSQTKGTVGVVATAYKIWEFFKEIDVKNFYKDVCDTGDNLLVLKRIKILH